MDSFPIHVNRTVTPEATQLLAGVEIQLGFVPQIFAVLADSPTTLAAFVGLNERLAESSLSAAEQETVQLAASVERESEYCVAGHTRFAQDQRVAKPVIDSLRRSAPVPDVRLDALASFTRALVRSDGRVSSLDLDRFLSAGYEQAQAFEVILGVCVKTLSNLASNLMQIPLDDAFAGYAWTAER